MRWDDTELPGVRVLHAERVEDERGFFARTWSEEEFRAHGADPRLSQISVSFNRAAATLRGMHYQAAPHEETKVVRCTRGAIYDVALDLRRDSPSYLRWVARELTADNHLSLYIPAGVAHGFQTLTPDAEVLYLISVPFVAASSRGVRWDDPAFGIQWPLPPAVMSERDRLYPDYAS